MRKRPLCLAAIVLLLVLWILPKEVWLKQPDLPSGELLAITGTVVKREQKEDQQVYYLKNCLCKQTNSKFSGGNLDTIFLTTSLEYAYLSSSTVKEIASFGGDISQTVPDFVAQKVYEKFGITERLEG